ELYNEYDVEAIIRIGSAGSYSDKANVYDVVLADSAYSESSFAKVAFNVEDDVLKPSASLNELILEKAKDLDIDVLEGRIHSSDVFYRDSGYTWKNIRDDHDVICVEMESFAL